MGIALEMIRGYDTLKATMEHGWANHNVDPENGGFILGKFGSLAFNFFELFTFYNSANEIKPTAFTSA